MWGKKAQKPVPKQRGLLDKALTKIRRGLRGAGDWFLRRHVASRFVVDVVAIHVAEMFVKERVYLVVRRPKRGQVVVVVFGEGGVVGRPNLHVFLIFPDDGMDDGAGGSGSGGGGRGGRVGGRTAFENPHRLRDLAPRERKG